jgi:urease accessory protein
MKIVRQALSKYDASLPRVAIRADRLKLSKRIWRGVAVDGADFGFELEQPLAAGDVVANLAGKVYCIEQTQEPVLEIALPNRPDEIARLAWSIGNLHFPVQVLADRLRVTDDPALRQLLEQQHVSFSASSEVFQPLAAGHHH